jgi:tRNA(fMet)-specific endonuclease VapC
MKAFDTDVVTDIGDGIPSVLARLAAVPPADCFIPILVVEEVLRGRLNSVRRAQAGQGTVGLDVAYAYLESTLSVLRRFQILPYTVAAHTLFLAWRAAKIRIGTQDLRIAAVAFAHSATLVTRNARDYRLVPGLALNVWK